MFIEQCI